MAEASGSPAVTAAASVSAAQNDGRPSLTSTPLQSARTPCPGSSMAPSNGSFAPAARATAAASGIDHLAVRQRQRSGLVENDRIDIRQPLDRRTRIEQHAGAKQRARHNHL